MSPVDKDTPASMSKRPFEPSAQPTRAQRKAAAERQRKRRESLLAGGVNLENLHEQDPYAAYTNSEGMGTQSTESSVAERSGAEYAATPRQTAGQVPGQSSRRKLVAPAEKVTLPRTVVSIPERSSKDISQGSITRRFSAGLLLASLGAMVLTFLRLPVVTGSLQWKCALGGGLLLVGGALWAWRYAHLVRFRWRAVLLLVSSILVGAFVWGTFTSVIIDGKVYAATSQTAKAWRVSHEVKDNLSSMAKLDVLLTYNSTDARAHYDQYDPAIKKLNAIRDRWSKVDPATVPNGDLREAVVLTSQGADWGSQSMEKKKEDAVTPDIRLEDDSTSFRATFAQDVLGAGASLRTGAAAFGIDISKGGPTE